MGRAEKRHKLIHMKKQTSEIKVCITDMSYLKEAWSVI